MTRRDRRLRRARNLIRRLWRQPRVWVNNCDRAWVLDTAAVMRAWRMHVG